MIQQINYAPLECLMANGRMSLAEMRQATGWGHQGCKEVMQDLRSSGGTPSNPVYELTDEGSLLLSQA